MPRRDLSAMTSESQFFRALAIVVLFGTVICGHPQTRRKVDKSAQVTERSIGRHLTEKSIRNFGEVTPMLYRGGQPSHAGLETLAKMGIGIVVNTSGRPHDQEGKDVSGLGMKYVVIRWHCPFPKDEPFARFLKVVHDNPGKKIFIHCRLGDDRTGMMIAAYRMGIEGWSAEDAMKEMKEFGFSWSHHVICPALSSYEKHFPEHLKDNPAFQGLRLQPESEK